MTAQAIPSQEAADDPFRFLVTRGWRPTPSGDGTWRHNDGRVLAAQGAIDHELSQPAAPAATQEEAGT